jgi:hypothetical protein
LDMMRAVRGAAFVVPPESKQKITCCLLGFCWGFTHRRKVADTSVSWRNAIELHNKKRPHVTSDLIRKI